MATATVDQTELPSAHTAQADSDQQPSWMWSFYIRAALVFSILLFGGRVWLGGFEDALSAAWVHYVLTPLGLNRFHPTFQANVTHMQLAVVFASAWLAIDRRRRHEAEVFELFWTLSRYALGAFMIAFGIFKVFPTQMPGPSAHQLLAPFGDLMDSEFSMLWQTVGSSTPYEWATGWIEVVAGALLFPRRTAILGVLLTAASTSTILMIGNSTLNVFDPMFMWRAGGPLLASLLLMPVVIQPLLNFFVLEQPVRFVSEPQWRWTRWLTRLAGAAMLWSTARTSLYSTTLTSWEERGHTSPIAGVYVADQFTRNGLERDSAGDRWHFVTIDDRAGGGNGPSESDCYWVGIQTLDDSRIVMTAAAPPRSEGPRAPALWRKPSSTRALCVDAISGTSGTMRLRPASVLGRGARVNAAGDSMTLTYTRLGRDELAVVGKHGGDTILAQLRRIPSPRIER